MSWTYDVGEAEDEVWRGCKQRNGRSQRGMAWGIHGDGVAQQPRVVLGLVVELCLVIHDPQHHSSWKLARWYVRTGRLG